MAAGAGVHLLALVLRGVEIGFFPLTNKHESFSAASLAFALVVAATWQPRRMYAVPMILLALAAGGVAISFPLELNYPPPLMRTIWYPLHVPLSFAAYALWGGAAAAGLTWFQCRERSWLGQVDRLALWGFGAWSLGMITGGFWGVVAWGAYFLWDPKVIWSVILWFHYAAFVHIPLTPSLRHVHWVRPAVACVGLVFVFIAYVGTSFFFGDSSHAF
jgi:ABC-type transport system involved in cytochrome c biogenesis permease subunit